MNYSYFDLKTFRKQRDMKQDECARLLGVGQEKISRLEKDFSTATVDIIVKLHDVFGISYERLLGTMDIMNMTSFGVRNSAHDLIKFQKECIAYTMNQLNGQKNEILKLINCFVCKPKTVITGSVLSGKSTLVNTILGKKVIPTDCVSVVDIPVLIKHIDDRPEYMRFSDTFIFKKDEEGREWKEEYLQDEEYCKRLLVMQGGQEILKHYKDQDMNVEYSYALIFCEADILMNTDLIDMPGMSFDRECHVREEVERADLVLYLSNASQFIRIQDAIYLSNILPDYIGDDMNYADKIMVVASKADIVYSERDMEHIFKSGTESLLRIAKNSMVPEYEQNIRNMMYSFSCRNEDVSKEFLIRLANLVEQLPIRKEGQARCHIVNLKKQMISDLNEALVRNQEILVGYSQNSQKLIDSEKNRLLILKIKELSKQKTLQYRNTDIEMIDSLYSKIMTKDFIINVIKTKNLSKEKDDIFYLCNYLSDYMQDEINKCIEAQMHKVEVDIDQVMLKFNENDSEMFKKVNISSVSTVFYAKDEIKNIVANDMQFSNEKIIKNSSVVVSIISSLLLSNPIVSVTNPTLFGIGIAATITSSALGSLSGNWEEKIAKKIITAFEQENYNKKIKRNVTVFWKRIENVLMKNFESFEKSYIRKCNEINDLLQNVDFEKINEQNRVIMRKEIFWENFPQ